jgi:hypothetical protein
MKRCSKCQKYKPLNNKNFYRDSTRMSGFFPWCITCTKEEGAERRQDPELRKVARQRAETWYKNNRPTAADTFYLKRYGLSLAQVRKKKKKQKHRCAICKRFKRLCVDHDHKTGKIRDMLCRGCNGFLGLLENNSNLLKSFEKYIRRHR